MPRSLRVVWIGSRSTLGTVPLGAVAGRHEVLGVVETARRPTRAGPPWRRAAGALRPAPATWARWRGLPWRRAHDLAAPDLGDWIARLRPDVLVVSAVSHLLPESLFARAPFGAVNLHPALLPRYRGPFPVLWQYLRFDLDGGVTAHVVDAGEDTGPILAAREVPIRLGAPIDDTVRDLARAGGRCLLGALDRLAGGGGARPQTGAPGPRARRLAPGEDPLDWERWSVEHLYHVTAGLGGWGLPPAPRLGLLRRRWRVVGFDRTPAPRPGALGRDREGFFAGNATGRVRLVPALTLARAERDRAP